MKLYSTSWINICKTPLTNSSINFTTSLRRDDTIRGLLQNALNKNHPANKEQKFASFHRSSASCFSLAGLVRLPVPPLVQKQLDNYTGKKENEEKKYMVRAKRKTEHRTHLLSKKVTTQNTNEPAKDAAFRLATYEKNFNHAISHSDVNNLTQNRVFRSSASELEEMGIQFSHPMLKQWSPESLDKHFSEANFKNYINNTEAEEGSNKPMKLGKYQLLAN